MPVYTRTHPLLWKATRGVVHHLQQVLPSSNSERRHLFVVDKTTLRTTPCHLQAARKGETFSSNKSGPVDRISITAITFALSVFHFAIH